MSDYNLINCPDCAADDAFVIEAVDEWTTMRYHIICSNCGCRTGNFEERAEAAAAWNRRADEPAPAADAGETPGLWGGHCMACGEKVVKKKAIEGDWHYSDCLNCGYRSGFRYVDGQRVVKEASDVHD